MRFNSTFINKGVDKNSKLLNNKIQRVVHKLKTSKNLSQDDLNLDENAIYELDKLLREEGLALPIELKEKLPDDYINQNLDGSKDTYSMYKPINLNTDPNKNEITNIKLNAQSKVDSKWKQLNERSPIGAASLNEIDNIDCLRGQDDEIYEMYKQLVIEYESCLTNITSKRILDFRSSDNPTISEHNIGIAMLYVLAWVDSSILLSSNKKELFEVSWDYIKTALSSSGSIWKYCRILRKYIEMTGISENFLRYIKFHLENAEPSKVINSSSSVIIFEYLVSTYKIAEFLYKIREPTMK